MLLSALLCLPSDLSILTFTQLFFSFAFFFCCFGQSWDDCLFLLVYVVFLNYSFAFHRGWNTRSNHRPYNGSKSRWECRCRVETQWITITLPPSHACLWRILCSTQCVLTREIPPHSWISQVTKHFWFLFFQLILFFFYRWMDWISSLACSFVCSYHLSILFN